MSSRLVAFLGKVSVPAGAGTESFNCWESMYSHLLFMEEELFWCRGCTDWMENKILDFLFYKNTQGKPSLPVPEKYVSGLRSSKKIWQSFFWLWNTSISSKGLPVWWGWTTSDDDRDWGFALVGFNMVSGRLRTSVARLSNLVWRLTSQGPKIEEHRCNLCSLENGHTNMVASWFLAGDLEALKHCWDPASSELWTGVLSGLGTLEDGDCLLW